MRHVGSIAAGSLVVIVSSAGASFSISSAPSIRPSTLPGTSAFDLFAYNDPGGTDGNALQGISFTFTGIDRTQVLFSTEDNGDGTFGNDIYNFSTTTTAVNPAPDNVNASNLRIGSARASEQAFTNVPNNFNSTRTTFSADYAIILAATAGTRATATTAPGARFARLVFNTTTPNYTISGFAGGEVGSKVPISYHPNVFVDRWQYVIISPSSVTVDVSPAGLEGFGPVQVSANDYGPDFVSALYVELIPPQIADNLIISETVSSQGQLIRTITGSGFTYADRGTYRIPFTATGGIGDTNYFNLTIVPEPAGLASLTLLAVAARRCYRG